MKLPIASLLPVLCFGLSSEEASFIVNTLFDLTDDFPGDLDNEGPE